MGNRSHRSLELERLRSAQVASLSTRWKIKLTIVVKLLKMLSLRSDCDETASEVNVIGIG